MTFPGHLSLPNSDVQQTGLKQWGREDTNTRTHTPATLIGMFVHLKLSNYPILKKQHNAHNQADTGTELQLVFTSNCCSPAVSRVYTVWCGKQHRVQFKCHSLSIDADHMYPTMAPFYQSYNGYLPPGTNLSDRYSYVHKYLDMEKVTVILVV